MMGRTITIRGETYIHIEDVAACYHCSAAWLLEAHDLGLLDRVEEVDGALAISAALLDRVAEIVRLHEHLGVELWGIRLALRNE
jgi:hypothetical protein